jgi:hypothetical protein
MNLMFTGFEWEVPIALHGEKLREISAKELSLILS